MFKVVKSIQKSNDFKIFEEQRVNKQKYQLSDNFKLVISQSDLVLSKFNNIKDWQDLS